MYAIAALRLEQEKKKHHLIQDVVSCFDFNKYLVFPLAEILLLIFDFWLADNHLIFIMAVRLRRFVYWYK